MLFKFRLAGDKENDGKGPEVSSHASEMLSSMVNSLNPNFKSASDTEAVVEMAMSAIPALSDQQAQVLTTILFELTPNVTPEIVKESVEIATEITQGDFFLILVWLLNISNIKINFFLKNCLCVTLRSFIIFTLLLLLKTIS
jgi:hypothetical protein